MQRFSFVIADFSLKATSLLTELSVLCNINFPVIMTQNCHCKRIVIPQPECNKNKRDFSSMFYVFEVMGRTFIAMSVARLMAIKCMNGKDNKKLTRQASFKNEESQPQVLT